MNFHAHYAGITEPVETCLVGSGSFGRSYLAQSRRTRLVNARIAVDVTAEAAGKAFAAAGFGPGEIALCTTGAEAKGTEATGAVRVVVAVSDETSAAAKAGAKALAGSAAGADAARP